jgi:hypothetical protein
VLKNAPEPAVTQEDQSVLAQIGAQLLRMPSVIKAVKQSLNLEEVGKAKQIADSLGEAWETPAPIDDAIVAQVAVATAEAESDKPLLDDGKTPAINATALLPPLDEAQEAAYAQVGFPEAATCM